MTRNSIWNVWMVAGAGDAQRIGPYYENAARPSINLSSEVKILSGTGLPNDPYIVGL